jgi:hypothetical protein
MFGYQCYSISGKFFVGFSNKNDYQVIVRLPKAQQEKAVKSNSIKPFFHGARMGWVEINAKKITTAIAMKWISYGYNHAKKLAKSK